MIHWPSFVLGGSAILCTLGAFQWWITRELDKLQAEIGRRDRARIDAAYSEGRESGMREIAQICGLNVEEPRRAE